MNHGVSEISKFGLNMVKLKTNLLPVNLMIATGMTKLGLPKELLVLNLPNAVVNRFWVDTTLLNTVLPSLDNSPIFLLILSLPFLSRLSSLTPMTSMILTES